VLSGQATSLRYATRLRRELCPSNAAGASGHLAAIPTLAVLRLKVEDTNFEGSTVSRSTEKHVRFNRRTPRMLPEAHKRLDLY